MACTAPEPVPEPERRRRHPDRTLAADDRHGQCQRDAAKPQLLLCGVHSGEGDPKRKELGDAGEEVRVRVGRQYQLRAERNGEEDRSARQRGA